MGQVAKWAWVPAVISAAVLFGIGAYMTTISVLAGGGDAIVNDPMVNTHASMGIMVGLFFVFGMMVLMALIGLSRLRYRAANIVGMVGSILIGVFVLYVFVFRAVTESDLSGSWPVVLLMTVIGLSAILVGGTTPLFWKLPRQTN